MAGKINRALVSVSDKAGIADFAKGLHNLGIEIISTGGTSKAIRDAGVPVADVSEVTGFPEMMDGRVKTLHPKIHGGILAVRANKEHEKALKQQGIKPIDLVCVNLYPFESTVAKPKVKLEDAIENIDIGGPSLLRAAAKNYRDVAVVCNPVRYTPILSELKLSKNTLSDSTRFELALEAFKHTAHYDAVISGYLECISRNPPLFNTFFSTSFEKVQELRYGENPHQRAALYKLPFSNEASPAKAKLLQGKPLSYNNLLDADSALELAKEFQGETAAVIIKHNNPCGAATGKKLVEAYEKALGTDPDAAFGGVACVNKTLDEETAKKIISIFTEVVVAPDYEPKALEVLKAKPNLRALAVGPFDHRSNELSIRSITGGLLVQDRDLALYGGELKCVTKRKPTADEMAAMKFAWKVCKHAKSNATIFAWADRTVGIGVGQMKRSDATRLGAMIAHSPTKGTALASDAFFPFRDGIDAAADAGATSVIQPGGSIRDAEVIKAADEHKLAMVFTGMRHFKH